jgi:hypothetical protein
MAKIKLTGLFIVPPLSGFARYPLYIYTDRNAKVFALFQRMGKVYSLIGKYSNMEILAKETSSKPEAGIDITGDGIPK